jgi:hypothetical protein
MMANHAAVALTTSIGGGLLLLLYFLYRRLFLDSFRDRLFHLREKWFNLALDPQSTLVFDSALYRSVEQWLCGILRFAHRISFFFIIVERISEHVQNVNVDVSPVEYIARTVNNIPDEYTRKAALAIWKEIPWLILRYLLLTSFLFFFWTMSLFVLLILRSAPHISQATTDREEACCEEERART